MNMLGRGKFHENKGSGAFGAPVIYYDPISGETKVADKPEVKVVAKPEIARPEIAPMVVGENGMRLAKRHGDTRIATYRESGKTPEEILGFLAASCGWAEKGERVTLHDLLPRFDLGTIPHAPFMI